MKSITCDSLLSPLLPPKYFEYARKLSLTSTSFAFTGRSFILLPNMETAVNVNSTALPNIVSAVCVICIFKPVLSVLNGQTLQSLFALDRSPSEMTVIPTMQEMSWCVRPSQGVLELTQFAEIVIRIDTGSPRERSVLWTAPIVLGKIEATVCTAYLAAICVLGGNFQRKN